MKYSKLLCLLWVVLCVSCHNDSEKAFYDDEHICYAQVNDTTLFVHPFVHEGQQYVVLPSYWNATKLVASNCNDPKAEVSGKKSVYQPCDEEIWGGVKMIKSKLPTIFIRTESGSMDFINANKKKKRDISLWLILWVMLNMTGIWKRYMVEVIGHGDKKKSHIALNCLIKRNC